MTFTKFVLIMAAVLIGMMLFLSDEAIAGGSSGVVVRPAFDDDFGRVVIVRERPFFRPFFNPFLDFDDFFFAEEADEGFFFGEDRPFFGREEEDD